MHFSMLDNSWVVAGLGLGAAVVQQ